MQGTDAYVDQACENDITLGARVEKVDSQDALRALFPESVTLTDAWNFDDCVLGSAIGRADGNAYETILEWSRQLPINVEARKNQQTYTKPFEDYIKPMLLRHGPTKL